MMVLVDTSAWIEYLRGTDSSYTTYVREAIRADRPLAWTEPILYELTAGARSPRRAEELRALLLRGPILAVDGLQDREVAARRMVNRWFAPVRTDQYPAKNCSSSSDESSRVTVETVMASAVD